MSGKIPQREDPMILVIYGAGHATGGEFAILRSTRVSLEIIAGTITNVLFTIDSTLFPNFQQVAMCQIPIDNVIQASCLISRPHPGLKMRQGIQRRYSVSSIGIPQFCPTSVSLNLAVNSEKGSEGGHPWRDWIVTWIHCRRDDRYA
jgi:hypothetical protein